MFIVHFNVTCLQTKFPNGIVNFELRLQSFQEPLIGNRTQSCLSTVVLTTQLFLQIQADILQISTLNESEEKGKHKFAICAVKSKFASSHNFLNTLI